MLQKMIMGSGDSGGGKVVTKAFSITAGDTVQTFSVDELSQIDELIVYNVSPEYNTLAFKLNGTDYITPCTTNPTRNTITSISGNTFSMKWQAQNSFTYIAVQNA